LASRLSRCLDSAAEAKKLVPSPYKRECTPEEVAILEADAAAAVARQRAEEERLRDEWLELLKAELADEAAG